MIMTFSGLTALTVLGLVVASHGAFVAATTRTDPLLGSYKERLKTVAHAKARALIGLCAVLIAILA